MSKTSSTTDETFKSKQMTAAIIRQVIMEDLKKEGITQSIILDNEQIFDNNPGDDLNRHAIETAHKLKRIGELLQAEFIKEEIMDHMGTEEGFKAVAIQYTNIGGLRSWAGIAVFICASCKFATKTLLDTMTGLPVIGKVFKWIIDFINDHLLSWIAATGGWESVPSMSTTTAYEFSTGVLTGITLGSIVTGLVILAIFKLRSH